MRRKDREISDIEGIRSILDKCRVCHLAMTDKGMPYVVPLNFCFKLEGAVLTLYFHSAKAGRKIDILMENDNVCFEMAIEGRLGDFENPCNCGYFFESVLGFGKAQFVEDTAERCEALSLLLKQQSGREFTFTEKQADSVCVFKVVSEDFIGKRKPEPKEQRVLGGIAMKEIFERRSVREFEDRKVEAGKLEKLLKAAMAAPTAWNQRDWEFIVVTEREQLEELATVSPYSGCVTEAPLAIVLLSNTEEKPSPQHWEQDLGACAENILLEAVHLGLGGVWLGIAPDEERMQNVSDLFALPPEVKPFAIIPVGYPKSAPEKIERYEPDKVHYNGYR